ncbi:MAG: hypothetical protein WC446_07280, partial [Candidatus Paceibacterota bacterium]
MGSKILVSVRPLKEDKLKLRGLHLEKEVVFTDNITVLKVKDINEYISSLPYTALINSKLLSFYLYQVSSQWGKGAEKRAKLRNVDLEILPIKKISSPKNRKLFIDKINAYIQERENGRDGKLLLAELDELVYNFYELTDYEKEIINEF